MSDRLPSLKTIVVIRALGKAGFEVTRIKGSHRIMRHRDDPRRATVVPVHAGKDIKLSLLHKIIGDAGLTVNEFKPSTTYHISIFALGVSRAPPLLPNRNTPHGAKRNRFEISLCRSRF